MESLHAQNKWECRQTVSPLFEFSWLESDGYVTKEESLLEYLMAHAFIFLTFSLQHQ